ncbi:hypothetical protein AYO47_06225 [Planctomyces sp. SCGC AG-212-M04]|nr:hypothetical protein AYO47_06225 [Planctomyces sp. SCGC AG-212-M04]
MKKSTGTRRGGVEGQPRADVLKEAQRRRDAIETHVKSKGRLPFDEAMKLFNVKLSTLQKDAEYFRRMEKPVEAQSKEFFFTEEGQRLVKVRERMNRGAKDEIAAVGAMLILGPEDEGNDVTTSSLDPWLDTITGPPGNREVSYELKARLNAYTRKAHRLVILDSGTTTAAIARILATVVTPDPRRHLARLRVLTNGRTVAERLDVRDSTHEIILLGGVMTRATAAVSGLLAERCLESWTTSSANSAFADLAVIGATSVDSEFDLYCDNESEAQIKSRLLQLARIRCIAADSSKLIAQSGGSWSFCCFKSSFLDIFITDEGILKPQTSPDAEHRRKRFLAQAKAAGIHVLIGVPLGKLKLKRQGKSRAG